MKIRSPTPRFHGFLADSALKQRISSHDQVHLEFYQTQGGHASGRLISKWLDSASKAQVVLGWMMDEPELPTIGVFVSSCDIGTTVWRLV